MLLQKRVRVLAGAVAVATATVLSGAGSAAAEGDTGSSDTNDAGSFDTGIGILDSGSAIGTQVLDFGSSVLGLPTWSSITSGSGGFGQGPAQQQCNASTQAGGPGVTDTIHHLGRPGPTSFLLTYDTEYVPDVIDVFYQGALVHSTGRIGDEINEGNGSAVVSLPPGADSSVLVRVSGPSGTEWSYTVHCP